jgi:tetratricopeptide (TPR) repeat protein
MDDKLGLFMRKGDASLTEQKYSEAVAWYEQVTQADPRHAHAFTMLAAAHYMAGGITAAMRNFDKALDLEPASLNALTRSGQLHLQVCNLDRAGKDFDAALAIEPGHSAASKAKGDIAAIRRHLQEAEVRIVNRPWQRCAALGVAAPAGVWPICCRAKRAPCCVMGARSFTETCLLQGLIARGNWDSLPPALDPVLDLASDCMAAQLLLARQSLHNNDFEGCTMATGRVLKIQPSSTDALLLRASAFFKLEVRTALTSPFIMQSHNTLKRSQSDMHCQGCSS